MSEDTKQRDYMTTQEIADEALRLVNLIQDIFRRYYPESIIEEENDDDDK